MELTLNTCNAIAQTLPTGYYCGRKVGVNIVPTTSKYQPYSMYNSKTDTIDISYNQLAKSLENVDENTMSKECAVRSALYSTLSHNMLTPFGMDMDDKVYKCFEDERVETLLNNYYMDVNFKQQFFNSKGSSTPTINELDPMSKFEALVRYRYGNPALLQRVKDIIEKYSRVNATEYRNREYEREIRELYADVRADNTPQEQMQQDTDTLQKELKANVDRSTKPQSGKENEQEQTQQGQGQGQGDEQQDGNEGEGEGAEGNEQKQDGDGNTFDQNAHGHAFREQMHELGKQIFDPNKKFNLSAQQAKELEKARKTIEMMIANFNKKNSGGSGYNGYSGVFNPRAVVRDDYKYFDRRASINGNNPFGTCHLNLLIDQSGSFWQNENIVNALLCMLTEIEDNTPCFSMDVGFIDTEIHPTTHDTREIHCGGGNDINPKKYKAYMDGKRKINSYNYNIVLFDGQACCNAQQFSAVDRENTTLITDQDNERFMRGENKFKKARVVVTSHYTDELINNIVLAIGRMFS